MAPAISAETATDEDKRKPLPSPKVCPKCGEVRYQRRKREGRERQWSQWLDPALKLRPYRCRGCRHQGWKLESLGRSRLALAGLIALPVLIVTLASLLLALLFEEPARDLMHVPAPAPTLVSAAPALPAPTVTTTAPPPAPSQPAVRANPVQVLESATLGKQGAQQTLNLRTSVPPQNAKTWILRDGHMRFVIDLPGRWSMPPQVPRNFTLQGTAADHIGIAAHDDHLRVSIRMRRHDPERVPQLEETAEGLSVILN